MLRLGEAPFRWTRPHHFPPMGDPTAATIPTCCGPWHDGADHFVAFYMCPEYWSILDPLDNAVLTSTVMQRQLHVALRESFNSRGLPTPPLPTYRQLLSLRSNGIPLDTHGHMAPLRCPLHYTYFSGAHPRTLSLLNISLGTTCWPYIGLSLTG